MARAPDERVNKAFELYKSGMKLVEIASQLNLPPGTVRRWKSTYKWDGERSDKKSERSDNISWIDIEHEYVTDIRKKPCSLENLSDKYSIPLQTVMDHSAKNEWSKKRREYKESTKRKVIEKTSQEDADRISKLLRITDVATKKAEQALNELETYVVKNKKKTKIIEYKDNTAVGKPTKEVIEEIEDIERTQGPVDRQGLLFVTNAIKNIKDVYSLDNGAVNDGVKYNGIPATMVAPAFIKVIHDIEQQLYTEYVFPGGRGSTKSSFVSLEVLDLLMKNEDTHAVVMRQVADTLRTSVYQQILWAISALGLEDEFHCTVSPLEITRKSTGQKIYFRGADDANKIKSIKVPFGYIAVLWLEELDQFLGEEAVRKIEQSVIRGGDKAYIFKSFNPPKSANNWANKYIKIPKATRLVTHSTYLDVPKQWLGKPFLDEAEFLKEVNPTAYENEYMGVANGTGGNVFDNVTIREITDEEIAQFDRLYNGIDWGWYPDPWAFNKMYYNAAQHRLYILDEDRRNKTKNEETARILREEHGITPNDKITCDSAEQKSIGDYKDYGLFARGAIKGPGSVEYSMKWLASLTEIIIDNSRTPHTATEFLDYEYERDKDGNIISGYPDKNNHHIDAIRYALEEVWRRRGQ